MMRNWRERIRKRRRPMRERGRTERRLPRWSHIELPSSRSGQSVVVLRGQLHEQIVRMLSVVDGVPFTYLAGREQIRIATSANRPRLCAQHGSQREAARSEVTLRRPHCPVDAAKLMTAPVDFTGF